jgi:hypothetical protein
MEEATKTGPDVAKQGQYNIWCQISLEEMQSLNQKGWTSAMSKMKPFTLQWSLDSWQHVKSINEGCNVAMRR